MKPENKRPVVIPQIHLSTAVIDSLRSLAEQYETPAFLTEDLSCFMHTYHSAADQETAAFIAANLAFGRREQILCHIQTILSALGESPAQSIIKGTYHTLFPEPCDCSANERCSKFYRFYSYADMHSFFDELQHILITDGSLGSRVKQEYERSGLPPDKILSSLFPDSRIVSHGEQSANKRLHMFLRWMVRQNSPVDLGLWTWYSPADLLIPLDTHVLQQAASFGLCKDGPGTAKKARELTDVLKQIWPQDPVRGDYALFGSGVHQTKK